MAIKADDRLIVALDFHTMEDVKASSRSSGIASLTIKSAWSSSTASVAKSSAGCAVRASTSFSTSSSTTSRTPWQAGSAR